MADLACSYQMNHSTIGTILKNKNKIMEHVRSSVPMHFNIISRKVIEELENLLRIWMQDYMKTKYGEEAADVNFTARWFDYFKAHNNLRKIKLTGEAASADTAAAQEFPTTLKETIEEGEFSPQQIFNVDETGLYWKKMPGRTYISKEGKSRPGFKPTKDRLTLLLGGNTPGDMKIKPFNRKAWVTLAMFQDWFYHHFIPEVERYCRDKNIRFNILLLLDHAPGHAPFLDDFHANVKVVFLPPNTTSLLQSMDQGAIATFKKYYLSHTFRQALKATEAKLQAEEQNVVDNLVSISEKLDLDLEEQDFHEYFAVHHQELTNEDLTEVENQRKEEKKEELEVEPAPKHFQTKMMAQVIEVSLALFESQDPNVEWYTRVAAAVHNALHCYRAIYDEKKKATTQTSLDRFFKRMGKCDESHHDGEPVPSTSGVTAFMPQSSHPPSNVDVSLSHSADDSSSPVVDARWSPISDAPPLPTTSFTSSQ
ncbi:hypothetical protein GDO78_006932 [Eleutherodactylus coqui]|uniref:DDE-1 domain-containing protein n=1 Tax=Eleutherodactylus coqui TaxID=57060 RepID=A0A8J6KAI0_ELECQ|nr:hypothetical protein GDO78_006932 [Eleutherodactylus coqui]